MLLRNAPAAGGDLRRHPGRPADRRLDLVETVFAWPGIGRLAFEALLQREYNTLLGVFAVTAVMVVLLNLATDLLYAVVDPRIEVAT